MIQTKKVRNFREGPILSQIIKFAIPLMLTGIMQLLFNTADTIVVGRWGGDTPEACETALAAVGSCGSLINLITLLFMNLALGAGVSVAQDIGAKDFDGLHKTVHTAVTLPLFLGLPVMIFGFVLARPMLTLMGTETSVLGQAVPYMTAYFCGIPASMMYNYCAAILRSSGETARPMKYLFVGGVTNVVLNIIMVTVFHLGALGVGIATAASFWIACILILIHMTHTDAAYRVEFRKLGIDGKKLKRILRIGIPAGLQGMVYSVSHVVIQSSVNSLGKAVVAGNAASANLEGYVYQPMNSLYQAAVTFVGQHKGARKYQRMKKCILYCVLCVTVIGVVLGGSMVLAAPKLLTLYIPDNVAAMTAAMTRMMIYTVPCFLLGLMEVGSGVMRGLGRSTTAMITSLIGSVALRVLWISLMFTRFPMLEIIYVSFPVTWIITAFAHFLIAFIVLRREERRFAAEQLAEQKADAERIEV